MELMNRAVTDQMIFIPLDIIQVSQSPDIFQLTSKSSTSRLEPNKLDSIDQQHMKKPETKMKK